MNKKYEVGKFYELPKHFLKLKQYLKTIFEHVWNNKFEKGETRINKKGKKEKEKRKNGQALAQLCDDITPDRTPNGQGQAFIDLEKAHQFRKIFTDMKISADFKKSSRN